MRLHTFILIGMEDILVEWEAFAKSLYPATSEMTPTGLRDHAREILQTIARDLNTGQTREEQSRKSKGQADASDHSPETAAETHAFWRAQSGMDINQLASEFRALRASVLRLWSESESLDGGSLNDIMRFNEAIDQALAESISNFTEQVDLSRNLLLGMLGHDMRNPLNAMMLISQHLASLNAGNEVAEASLSLMESGASIEALLNDMVDFSRRSLGLGITLETGPTDLGEVCSSELKQHRAVHPDRQIELSMEGNLFGHWDAKRLQQVVRNLLSNAIFHGAPGHPISLSVDGNNATVRMEVRNTGMDVSPASNETIFEPLQRGAATDNRLNRHGLGLGLFIVREITRAHGGTVEMRQKGLDTVFTVMLPRNPTGPDTECSGSASA